ncbi:Protein yls7, variant 2 [Ancistrocladus abbreviatus]
MHCVAYVRGRICFIVNWGYMKDYHPISSYPRPLFSIIISVGLLAIFITFASWVLLSYPIGDAVRSYFYGADGMKNSDSPIIWEDSSASEVYGQVKTDMVDRNTSFSKTSKIAGNGSAHDSQIDEEDLLRTGKIKTKLASYSSSDEGRTRSVDLSENQESHDLPTSSVSGSNESSAGSVDSGCNLYHGHWFYDSSGPLYKNNSCPVLTQMQNCQGNGRPDKEYENWRWRPTQCELPRFNGTKFLELMNGKTLAFVGDSVARNQMESLLCMLWQVGAPEKHGNRHMQRWYFRSKSVTIVRIWSSWLVQQTSEPFGDVPKGGSCTGKVKPALPAELVENGFTNIMHEKQLTGFNRAIKKSTNRSKLKLMDITLAFSYRHDGHPGPFRSPDPNKITKRSPDGRPPPQDCLHWGMLGPVDTWNELALEIIRLEMRVVSSTAESLHKHFPFNFLP